MCVRYIQLTFNVYKILLRHSTQTQYGACLPACLYWMVYERIVLLSFLLSFMYVPRFILSRSRTETIYM